MAGLEAWSDDQLAEFYRDLIEAERGQVPSQTHRAVRAEVDRRINESAPDAGQGIEGKEPNNLQGEDSVSDDTQAWREFRRHLMKLDVRDLAIIALSTGRTPSQVFTELFQADEFAGESVVIRADDYADLLELARQHDHRLHERLTTTPPRMLRRDEDQVRADAEIREDRQ